jgi:hypothetical protein
MSILMDVKELQRGGGGGDGTAGSEQGQHTRFWWFQIPVAFGSQIETSDSARKKVVRRAPLYPIHTQLGLERLKRWGGRG